MNDDSSKEKEQVKVIDRRRFSETGEETGADAGKDDLRAARREVPRSPEKDSPKREPGAEEVEFSAFIISLATQAMVLLGEMPNPETKSVSVNIDAAKQVIDVIDLLQRKTSGNLTPDEQKLMTDVVSSLKLAFVRKSGAGKK